MPVSIGVELSNTRAFLNDPTKIYFKLEVRGHADNEQRRNIIVPAVVVLIDSSGSMYGPKMDAAKEALKKLIDVLPDGSYVSIYSFSDTVNKLVKCHELSSSTRSNIKKQIDKIKANGSTSLYMALERALDDFQKLVSREVPLKLFLLTDGQPTDRDTEDPAFLEIAGKLRRLGVETIIFGIGEDYNEEFLANILERCGKGVLEHIVSSEEIGDIIHNYAVKAANIVAKDVVIEIEKTPIDKITIISDLYAEKTGNKIRLNIGDVAENEVKKIYGYLILSPRKVKSKYRIGKVSLIIDNKVVDKKNIVIEFTDDEEKVMESSRPEIAYEAMGLEALKTGDLMRMRRTLRGIRDEGLRRTIRASIQAIEKNDRKTLRSIQTKTLRGNI